MKNIVIIGAGDLGKEVVWLIEDINQQNPSYLILGFLDDDAEKLGGEFYGYKVLGTIDQLEELSKRASFSAVIAIRDGDIRRRIVEERKNFVSWESIVHPTAVIAGTSPVGRGTIVFPQVTVSVDTKQGDFGLYYIHSTICNDCVIGDFVSLMSGSTVAERTTVSDGFLLAAGAVAERKV